MVPSASASLGETGRGNSARLAWRGGRDRADAALNLLVRFYRESTHLHRQTHPAFSPTSRFALRNGSSVHLNINEDCGHFAAPTRPGALLRIAAALLLAARRRTGEKVSSKRDGEAVAITSNKRRNIKSVLRLASTVASSYRAVIWNILVRVGHNYRTAGKLRTNKSQCDWTERFRQISYRKP